ncbi:hypothetical protein JVU11DRAFT_5637 [Chiua virens]|nr:hypothetical protein JVU11DRAFT_5637 [Chiua virens]
MSSTLVPPPLFSVEHSLEEIKDVVRQKLGLGHDTDISLKQMRSNVLLELEDDDDFQAFCILLRSSESMDIQVTVGKSPAAVAEPMEEPSKKRHKMAKVVAIPPMKATDALKAKMTQKVPTSHSASLKKPKKEERTLSQNQSQYMAFNSQPLPENHFLPGKIHDAYNQCLAFEAKVMASCVQPIAGCPPPIVCVRLLGHLLCLAPAGDLQEKLQQEITSIKSGNAKFMLLGVFYLNNFIQVFRCGNGPNSASSKHSSESSEDYTSFSHTNPNPDLNSLMDIMKEDKLDHHAAQTLAMYRDNNHCLVTGLKDYMQYDGQVVVQMAHIIPENITEVSVCVTVPSSDLTKYLQEPPLCISLVNSFNVSNKTQSITQDLAGYGINHPKNILSLNAASHYFFDMLLLWLKPVNGSQNTYCVCTAKDSLRCNPSLPEYVTFSTTTDVPLPCHEYLAIHALCCEVAWKSGAAEYIADLERRVEDTMILQ